MLIFLLLRNPKQLFWIKGFYCLIECQETKFSKRDKETDAKAASKLEFESRSLLVVWLFGLMGKLVSHKSLLNVFRHKSIVNLFDDSMRMPYLITAVHDEPKVKQKQLVQYFLQALSKH